MSLVEVATLFVVMATLAIVPSASVALVVARSATAGFSNGCAVAAGIVVGDLVFVVFALLGMAALAEAMGSLFFVLRYVAGAYLIWLGISLVRSKSTFPTEDAVRPASKLSASFLSGVILTLGDMKAILFYASFFPAFVDLVSMTASDIAIVIVITILAVGSVKVGYAYFATRAIAFASEIRAQRAVRVTAGSLMVILGIYILAKS